MHIGSQTAIVQAQMDSYRRRQIVFVALIGASVLTQVGLFVLLVALAPDAIPLATALFLFGATVNTLVFSVYLRALRRCQ